MENVTLNSKENNSKTNFFNVTLSSQKESKSNLTFFKLISKITKLEYNLNQTFSKQIDKMFSNLNVSLKNDNFFNFTNSMETNLTDNLRNDSTLHFSKVYFNNGTDKPSKQPSERILLLMKKVFYLKIFIFFCNRPAVTLCRNI